MKKVLLLLIFVFVGFVGFGQTAYTIPSQDINCPATQITGTGNCSTYFFYPNVLKIYASFTGNMLTLTASKCDGGSLIGKVYFLESITNNIQSITCGANLNPNPNAISSTSFSFDYFPTQNGFLSGTRYYTAIYIPNSGSNINKRYYAGTVTVSATTLTLNNPLLVSPLSATTFTGTTTSVNLDWDANNNPSGTNYLVTLRDLTTNIVVDNFTNVGSSTNYNASVIPGHDYRWIIKAEKAGYVSAISSESTFSVQNPPLSSFGEVLPYQGTTATNFTFRGSYSGGSGNAVTMDVKIFKPDGSLEGVYQMTYNSSSGYYEKSKILSQTGTYQFQYIAYQSGMSNGVSVQYPLVINAPATPNLQLGSCTTITPNPLIQGQNKSFTYSVKNVGNGTFTGTIKLAVLKSNGAIGDVDVQGSQTIAPNETKNYTSATNILDAATNPVGTNYKFTVQSVATGSTTVNTIATIPGCTNPIITSVVAASTCAYNCTLNKTLADFPNTGDEGLCAAKYLCSKGIISSTQNTAPSALVLRQDLAKVAFLSILDDATIPSYVANPSAYSLVSDYFPTPYLDLNQNSGSDSYQRYAKILSYLEYTDGKAPFDRRQKFNPSGTISRGDVLKVLLEAWNIDEFAINNAAPMPYTDSGLNTHANYRYIKKAFELGIVQANAPTLFRPDDACKREELFVMVKRLRELNASLKPSQTCLLSATNNCDYFFTPANNNVFNLNMPKSLAEGNMPASIGGFSIPDVGFSLGFAGSYGSTLTELPDEWRIIEPLGAGWSHPYNVYAFVYSQDYYNTSTNSLATKPLLAFAWSDGTYNVYDRSNGSTPLELTLPSYNTLTVGTNQYTLKTKGQVTYTFTQQGGEVNLFRLSTITDRYGNTLTLAYKAGSTIPNGTFGNYNMVLDYVQAPSGRRVTFNYDALNQITQVLFSAEVAGATRQFTMTYDNKRLKTFKDARGQNNGKVTVFDYASNNVDDKTFKLINKITLPKGNVVQATYNASNKLQTLTENSLTTTITPPASFAVNGAYTGKVTSSDLVQTTTTFNKNAVPTAVSSPTVTVSLVPDGVHPTSPASITQNGKTGTYTYFANGNVQRVTYPDGTFEEYTYDGFNNVATHKDARGYTTVFNNTPDGKNLQSINQPSSSGTLTQTFGYYANGLVQTVTNHEGIATNYGYNSYGNLNNVAVPILNISSSAVYDNASRLKTNTNAKNQTTTYLYDVNDNLVGEKDAQNRNTTYDYDDNDNLSLITNAKGQQTVLAYDTFDRLETEVFDGKTKRYTYNAATGLAESFIKPSGSSFAYTYDANKMLKSNGYITYIDYEAGTFYLKNISGGTNQNLTNFSYDNLGRMTAYTDHYANQVGYGYDANGNTTRIDYPNNHKAYYEYDEANRLRKIRWNGPTANVLVEYVYVGTRLSYVQCGNGVRTTYGYDNAGRPNALTTKTNSGTGTTIFASAYSMDNMGNHLEESETHPFATIPTPTAGTTNYTYTQGNRIQTAGSTTFSFDNDGNTATKTGYTFGYDKEDNLTSVTGNATLTYEYDAFGNRRKAIRNGTETRYVLDINGQLPNVLAETNASNSTQNYYLHGLGLVARIKPDGTLHYYHPDFRGSVIAMTDANQTISHKYQYDEFGNLTNNQEADNNPFRYVGTLGIMHETNDLTFMRARYYDPTTARFLSEDPIWATNLYPYAGNNGIMNVDPSGENWLDKTIVFIVDKIGKVWATYLQKTLKNQIYTGTGTQLERDSEQSLLHEKAKNDFLNEINSQLCDATTLGVCSIVKSDSKVRDIVLYPFKNSEFSISINTKKVKYSNDKFKLLKAINEKIDQVNVVDKLVKWLYSNPDKVE